MDISEDYDVLSAETAAELESVVARRRESRSETHRRRVTAIASRLDDDRD